MSTLTGSGIIDTLSISDMQGIIYSWPNEELWTCNEEYMEAFLRASNEAYVRGNACKLSRVAAIYRQIMEAKGKTV